MKLIQKIPEENILSIASFLSIRDVHSLAGTCRSIRFTLITSQGAMKCIWMCRMQEAFPGVFRRATGRSPFGMSEEEGEGGGLLVAPRLISRIAFDSDSQVAVWRLPGTTDEISLPLLTHLLPQRYPQSMNPSILKAEHGHQPFCSCEAKSSILKDGTRVILVQLEGQVGIGDRCILPISRFHPPVVKFPHHLASFGRSPPHHPAILGQSPLLTPEPVRIPRRTIDCHSACQS